MAVSSFIQSFLKRTLPFSETHTQPQANFMMLKKIVVVPLLLVPERKQFLCPEVLRRHEGRVKKYHPIFWLKPDKKSS